MHCCLLGVARTLSNLWFDSTNHHEPYYIGTKISDINSRLLEIKPLSNITRMPRPISDRFHWKANEWRNWLLFYSLPCLLGILPKKYLNHFGFFVTAIFMLLKDNITHEEIDFANDLLIHFVTSYLELYDSINMTINVHLLSHLGKYVSLWGPLWTYSAFVFENGNGSLLNLIKGARGMGVQIVNKYLQQKTIPKLTRNFLVDNEVLNYCNDLTTFLHVKHAQNSSEGNVTLLGKPIKKTLTEEELLVFKRNNLAPTSEFFNKIIYKKMKFYCSLYKRPTRTNDCVALLTSGAYIFIERLIIIENKVFVLGRKIKTTNQSILGNNRAKASHISL